MLNPDFRDMLSALCDEGVEFLLVGAYALAAHGRPRALIPFIPFPGRLA
jgi:hypothetical protein